MLESCGPECGGGAMGALRKSGHGRKLVPRNTGVCLVCISQIGGGFFLGEGRILELILP